MKFKGLHLYLFTLNLIFCANCVLANNLKDFATRSPYHDAKLSPDGKHIAVRYESGKQIRLYFFELPSMKMVGNHGLGSNTPGDFYWANNERLIIKVLKKSFRSEGYYQRTFLYTVDYRGRKGKYFYFSRERSSILSLIDLLKNDEKNILVRKIEAGGANRTEAMTLNIYNGKTRRVVTAPKARSRFFADEKGVIRYAYALDKSRNQYLYKRVGESYQWKLLTNIKMGEGFHPISISDSGKTLLAFDNFEGDTMGLYRIDLETGKKRKVYRNNSVDITSLSFTNSLRKPISFRLDQDYPSFGVIDSNDPEAMVFKELVKTFAGNSVRITSRSDDGNKYLVEVSSDVNPGSYYLYNNLGKKLVYLFSSHDNLNPKKMSYTDAFSFVSSDSVKINGYVTYPRKQSLKKAPLVVLIHGGPHGARDYWEYNSEVQMLAHSGFAVLQVNYRGSTGYGLEFEKLGYRHWGDSIQRDIYEATNWIIEQGKVNPEKICIMGASFGAYSAVQSATLYPERYKCLIANAGVYDLKMLFEDGDIQETVYGKSFLKKVLGGDASQLENFSPTNNISKLKASIFLAHGEKDPRAPIEQLEELEDVLKEKGIPYEKMIRDREFHGFYSNKNRYDYYKKVVKFLKRNLN